MIGVSACLAGIKCRYNGASAPDEKVMAMVEKGEAAAFCPECLVGLEIPRAPSEIFGGDGNDVLEHKARVVSKDGKDLTVDFIEAAEKSLAFCKNKGIREVWLKSKSPSCGICRIYDGSFSGELRDGPGVTAACLSRSGIKTVEID